MPAMAFLFFLSVSPKSNKKEKNKKYGKIKRNEILNKGVELMSVSSPLNKKKKKQLKPVTVFTWVLVAITLGFVYVIADYFYFNPLRQSGKPVYGNRLSDLETIDPSLLQKIENTGESNEGISEVTLSVQGEIVYLSVKVEPDLSVETARQIVESMAQTFIEEAGESFEGYSLQLVLSSGETETLLSTNREEEEAYIKAHDVSVVEQVVAYTEKYPTVTNIERSQANINLLKKSYPEEAEVFQTRLNALTAYTAEEEEKLGDIPTLVVDQTIPTSDIADYPTWGVLDVETSTIQWH